jgi:hypothetical protein
VHLCFTTVSSLLLLKPKIHPEEYNVPKGRLEVDMASPGPASKNTAIVLSCNEVVLPSSRKAN